MIRAKVVYQGIVQGVGFRYTTRKVASRFKVNGYVRNLKDGTVELLAEGDEKVVDAFLEAVAERMQGFIKEVRLSKETADGSFQNFEVRFEP